jgi:sulfur relay (sulfurtransferase) DsrC/TusE family protein
MTVPLRYDTHGLPEPLGVRAAAAKMAQWIAAGEKGIELTADEAKIVAAVAFFFADEYERISTANEHLTRVVTDLNEQVAALLEVVRDLGSDGQAIG